MWHLDTRDMIFRQVAMLFYRGVATPSVMVGPVSLVVQLTPGPMPTFMPSVSMVK